MNDHAGSLVTVRGRDWVVLPSANPDIVLLKPLGGTEEEITGIYLPLKFQTDAITSAEFPVPAPEDLGDFASATALFDAARLSFRSGAGPFRSLAKLSFRPRAYQMVPLIMALRQERVRMLIADDVGIGKTIEALLILRELLERRAIRRFAVLCLPHLCEQWQVEINTKLNLDAVIIRSNTQAMLDRQIQGDTSVYEYYPYQIISIDFIKSDIRRQVFIEQSPEMIIVDEAHTCAKPAGALPSQQQRHALVSALAAKPDTHLVLLTATPHSGKPEEFQSLLGLLHPEFAGMDIPTANPAARKRLAAHFVQRRRADIVKWMGESTVFPIRESREFDYPLSPDYKALLDDLLAFVQGLLRHTTAQDAQMRVHYWTALGLLRGVMSSPNAGLEMLTHRIEKRTAPVSEPDERNPVGDTDFDVERDMTPTTVTEQVDWSSPEKQKLQSFATRLSAMANITDDLKAAHAKQITDDWLHQGCQPVIFCRYIATAHYLGTVLKQALLPIHHGLDIQVITGEDPDEERQSRILGMAASNRRLLIATDCLSEGINLQHHFNAVLHYDLPWNPNRLEQREGRVDRFGQAAPVVKTILFFAKANPIDGVVLEVVLRKVREIRKSIGISIPFPEDSQTILDTVLQSVLLKPAKPVPEKKPGQLELDFMISDEWMTPAMRVTNRVEAAAEREKASRSMFAQHAIKAEEIEADLAESDQSIGAPGDVERFVFKAVNHLIGGQLRKDQKGYRLHVDHLPDRLKCSLPDESVIPVSFESPTPNGYLYLGRNHVFVEQLCEVILSETLERGRHRAARAAVIKTPAVAVKTTILCFRVRNVIADQNQDTKIIAEEMILWGYRGHSSSGDFIDHRESDRLLHESELSSGLSMEAKTAFLSNELAQLPSLRPAFDRIAESRSRHLVQAHQRFSRLVDKRRFDVVYPVLPMDVLGIYILLPEPACAG